MADSKSYLDFLSSSQEPNWPMSKQTQKWIGKAEPIYWTRGSGLPTSSHNTWLPWSSLGPSLPTHLPPWLQATCHPPWPWQPTPALRELTSWVASSGHRDSRPTRPKRPEKPSAVPPPSPQDSDKAPDEVTALGPQGRGLQKSSTSLSAQVQTLQWQRLHRALSGQ